ncbi:T-cell surface glycoprotein CD3 zeta chain-like [Betta splendens]|uniref:T-cell surface glycoprotein CD3 zeta chain n=1 Tax=Betta splendens TaxID=158456 RepID=A0A6P7LMJ1_BETSP|nr:T-cell surface glycoprotein CD3 zeta chain-like [Betta splendens]
MQVRAWIAGLLVLVSTIDPTEALHMYDPQLCYLLDGFLGLYGLIITGMFIREKFFRTKGKAADNGIYADLAGPDGDGYAPLTRRDPESGGRIRRTDDNSTYTPLQRSGGDEYKELPVKREGRQRKNDQLYQGLSSATKDTYQSLQMQPLPAR